MSLQIPGHLASLPLNSILDRKISVRGYYEGLRIRFGLVLGALGDGLKEVGIYSGLDVIRKWGEFSDRAS